MKKKKPFFAFKILLFWAAMLTPVAAFAQNEISVSGIISDEIETLPGASVAVKGTTIGTTSDIDGKFTLKVPGEGSVLIISYIGYATQEIKVGPNRNLNIKLFAEDNKLDEVVVIGYGTVRKRDLTGATSSIKGNEITNIPVTTAAQAITGKVAGVNVVTQSGAPGADINILVRGGTSITQSTAPLYIVDGFQMDDGLRNVDINDIESIDVMKDASATAIYGARGANGVILITTKSGKEGKTVVSYNTYFSFEKLGKEIDMLGVEDYVKYQYEYQILRNNEHQFASYFGGNINDPDFYTGAYSRIASEYGNRPGINWQKEVFGETAVMQNHSVSVSGGSAKTKFMVNYNFVGQDGILDKTGYDRNSLRTKINHELFKGVRLDVNISLNSNKIEGGGSLDGKLKTTLLQAPTGGVRFTNEQMIGTDIRDAMLEYDSQYDISNPIIDNDAVTQTKYTRQVTTNAALEIDIPWVKGLTFRSAGSYFWQQVRNDYWDDGRTTAAKNNQGPYGKRDNSEKHTWQVTNTLTYNKTVAEDHNFTVMLGQETWYTETMELKNEYRKFPEGNFGLNNTSMATQQITSSSKAKQGIVSVFGRAMYNYQGKYLATATLRGDGSSKFSRDNQWGTLPSGSIGWRISEEDFMSGISPFMNNLKLRAGYGVTGNCNIDDNMYTTQYEGIKYYIGSAETPALGLQNTLGNPNLIWEKTKSTNIGLDLSFFKSRVNLSLDYYNNLSDNLLIKNDIAKSSGYFYQFQNIASIRNRGFEFVLNTVNMRTQSGFEWRSDLNMSFNKSKVLKLYGEMGKYMKTDVNSRMEFIIREDEPLGQFYGFKYGGLYTTDDFNQNADGTYILKDGVIRKKGLNATQIAAIKPGDVKFVGVTGQTDDNGNPVWGEEDRTVIGNAEPKFFGGFNNTFTYKGIDLGIFMNFSYGNKIFNMNTQRYVGPFYPNQNATGNMVNRFTLIDPATGKETTNLQRLAELNPNQYASDAIWSLNGANKEPATVEKTDYNLEDGSFLRINNITLGYTLPARLLKKASIDNIRIYGTVNNVYTFTNYNGFDPEVSSSDKILTRGVDDSAYPRTRSFVVGLNLTF
jgi:TonB-linked SusC/RagA family outer membrane protein